MFFARLLSFSLGLVFAWAAVAKLVGFGSWRSALAGYRLPQGIERPLSVTVPIVELSLAAAFFAGATRVAAAASLAVLTLFSLAIVRARALQGTRLPCGCFGANKQRDYRLLLARNTVLAAGAGALLVYGQDVPGYPSAPSDDAWVAAALVAVGVALLVWLFVSVRSGMRRDIV
jgi:hypothetical protein